MAPPAPYSSLRQVAMNPSFGGEMMVSESDTISAGMEWDEAIVSWNIKRPEQAWLKVEAQALWKDRVSPWYTLADWTGDMAKGRRTSIPDQKDSLGEVETDMLKLAQGCAEIKLRLSTRKIGDGPDPQLKLLTVSFTNSRAESPSAKPHRAAYGRTVEVPQLAQGPHEFGKLKYDPDKVSGDFKNWFSQVKGAQYCSPTCVTMVANHWSQKLGRSDITLTVPNAIASVFDEKYPGTGNWPFNTALLGSFEGMRSYVTRLANLTDLERLTANGIPVVCSVSSNMLKGKPPGGDGHLVVLVGFDKSGNPVFNDPGKADEIRRTYTRENFQKAWDKSGRTVYICHPDSVRLPKLTEPSVLID